MCSRSKFPREVLGGNARGNWETAMLTVCRVNDEERPFAETFKDAHMWFNHDLKVRDTDLISVRYL
jgi:hypothetical protein